MPFYPPRRPFRGRRLVWIVCLWLAGCVGRASDVTLPTGERTVDDVMALYGPAAEQRLLPYFQAAGLPYPPTALTLLGFKEEKRLAVWVQHEANWVFLRAYTMLAASGGAGPKLREGDEQVPEGVYSVEALNPNSQFHLSIKLDYPNALDRQQATREGRQQLGGDIFLHGKDVSTGCVALGDTAIEEVFVLVVRVDLEHVTVLLTAGTQQCKSRRTSPPGSTKPQSGLMDTPAVCGNKPPRPVLCAGSNLARIVP